MAIVSRSRRLAVTLLLLLLLFAVVAAAAVATKTEAGTEDAASKEDESWTGWAKEKITEGLGLKHHVTDVDEEEDAARKAGHAAKSAQHTASGTSKLAARRRARSPAASCHA